MESIQRAARGARASLDALSAAGTATGAAADPRDRSLLPEPSPLGVVGTDPGTELAILLVDAARDDRDLARSVRQGEERAIEAAEAQQLRALEDKADNGRIAGFIGGFATVASGAVAMGAAQSESPRVRSSLDGSRLLAEGGGKLAAVPYQDAEARAGQEATHQEQIAGRRRRALSAAEADERGARELATRALGYVREYLSAKVEAERAALLRA